MSDGILFLCVANSARSQMAEGLARQLLTDHSVFSAGSTPSVLNPLAVQAMQEEGIDISGHSSKSLNKIPTEEITTVITLCAEEICPRFLHETTQLDWALPDPAAVNGTEEEILAAFCATRDEIKRLIMTHLLNTKRPALLDDPRIDRELLKAYHFDPDNFAHFAKQISTGKLSAKSSVFRGSIKAVEDVFELDRANESKHSLGEQSLAKGELAVLVLNGGMATRFGNVVKGAVEVYDGLSFLALKAHDVKQTSTNYKTSIPFVLMNSFATRAATESHLRDADFFGLSADQVLSFEQSISLRMQPDGGLFIGADNKPSYHSPGHGDFLACIRHSGVLKELQKRGCKYLMFSNVDNLGATIDAHILGQHISSGAQMTAELTQRRQNSDGIWDKGGAPAIADGRKQLIEGFRFPPEFDQSLLPDFSTNNFWFNLKAIDRDLPLAKHVVEKTVDGSTVLQLESITCEASAVDNPDGSPALTVNYLRVPRDGDFGRFFPVKSRADLEAMRDVLKARLKH
jgi:UTP--glucose-1-phosphate uridylyltransferase